MLDNINKYLQKPNTNINNNNKYTAIIKTLLNWSTLKKCTANFDAQKYVQ